MEEFYCCQENFEHLFSWRHEISGQDGGVDVSGWAACRWVFSMGPREEEASLNNRLITFYFQPVASSHSLPQQPINNNNNDDDDVTLTYRETDSLYDETLEHSSGATVEVVDLTGSQSESHVPCLEDDLANYSPRTKTCKENQENTAPQVAYGPREAKRLKLLNNDSTCLFSGERCCDPSPQKICPDAVKSTPMQGRLTEVSVNLGVPFAPLEKSGDRVHGDAQGNSITDAPSRYAQGKKDLEEAVEEKRNILHAVYGEEYKSKKGKYDEDEENLIRAAVAAFLKDGPEREYIDTKWGSLRAYCSKYLMPWRNRESIKKKIKYVREQQSTESPSKRREWTSEQKTLLLSLSQNEKYHINKLGHIDWAKVGKDYFPEIDRPCTKLPIVLRNYKQHLKEHSRAYSVKSAHYTEDEDLRLLKSVEEVGKCWDALAASGTFKGRTAASLRQRYSKLIGSYTKTNPVCNKCNTMTASYGYDGEGATTNRLERCNACKEPDMVYLLTSTCTHEGCTAIAWYGLPRDGKRILCSSHYDQTKHVEITRACQRCLKECQQNLADGPVYRRFEGHLCARHYLDENESNLPLETIQCIQRYISSGYSGDNTGRKVKEDMASAWLNNNVSDVFNIRRESLGRWYPFKNNTTGRAYRIDFCFARKENSAHRIAAALEVDEWQHMHYCMLQEARRTRVITHDWLAKDIPFLLIRMNTDHYVLKGTHQEGAFFKKASVQRNESEMNKRMTMVKKNLEKFFARFDRSSTYSENKHAPGYMVKICFDGDSVEQYYQANRETGAWERIKECPF
ncbi:hypothetical protein PSENEW3_00003074 [Picochlorum sp. SENEW3]|nr:hypothetical protein PSENEW3_00003074 [Picochlorum sp. SENEW3]